MRTVSRPPHAIKRSCHAWAKYFPTATHQARNAVSNAKKAEQRTEAQSESYWPLVVECRRVGAGPNKLQQRGVRRPQSLSFERHNHLSALLELLVYPIASVDSVDSLPPLRSGENHGAVVSDCSVLNLAYCPWSAVLISRGAFKVDPGGRHAPLT